MARTSSGSYINKQHSFSTVETPNVTRQRSTFPRNSRTITAIDGGLLYPVYLDEVLPGDTYSIHMETLARLATPLRPFLDNLWLESFWFFQPNRIAWSNWAAFQGEKIDPDDTTTYTVPQITVAGDAGLGINKLADYMGLPTQATNLSVCAFPFRMYNRVYDEFFRDINLVDRPVIDTGDADSLEADHVLRRRLKRKDYITGSLPWPQAGDAVTLNLGDTAPVVGTGDLIPHFTIDNTDMTLVTKDTDIGESHTAMYDGSSYSDPGKNTYWRETKLEADLTQATNSTVNALRQSIAVQQIQELDARSGTRHREQLKARFGVTTADFRLQRPEYLGGGKQNISVTPVPYTSFNSSTEKHAGQLGGFGVAAGQMSRFTHSFVEHGYIMCLVSVRADYSYFQGVNRHWSRQTRFDYYEPMLSHLGEQAVYQKEVYAVGDNGSTDDDVWGYQERFSEYKYGNSMVTGIMRPNYVQNTAFWHLAEWFQSNPSLNQTFIEEDPPIDRVIAVPSEPHLLLDCFFHNRCTRVMPVFNTPGLTRL